MHQIVEECKFQAGGALDSLWTSPLDRPEADAVYLLFRERLPRSCGVKENTCLS